jgi:hypothetical protein
MEITKAANADIPELCDLLEVLFAQEAEFRPDHSLQSSGLRQIIDFPERGQILVLRKGTGVIGMISLLFTLSTALGGRVAILEDMVVQPDHRGGGAARSWCRRPSPSLCLQAVGESRSSPTSSSQTW